MEGPSPLSPAAEAEAAEIDALIAASRLELRRRALTLDSTAAFQVGRSNVVEGLARAIRLHFTRHALVMVGIRGRAAGTPVDEIVTQLEEATGGVFVSREPSKVVLYRGWEDGHPAPWEGPRVMQVTPQMVAAMQSEAGSDLGMHAVEGADGVEGTGSDGEVEEEGESWTDQFDQYGTEVTKGDVGLLYDQQHSEIRDS
ncbi:unnamed protein product [Closterium sp. Yama58-4]|nr:unnamed protein product [Closterium sp. Yama58-4]